MDEIIVWIIIALAAAYTVKRVVASFGKKSSGGCAGCAGCGGCASRGDCPIENSDSTDLEKPQSAAIIQTSGENKDTVNKRP